MINQTRDIGISAVIPVYNEAGAVLNLYQELKQVLSADSASWEIIFVDDGSTDNTLNLLAQLSPIKIIRLRKNFGQTAAIDAGIKASRGKLIVILDGDGQNDPADIPKLIIELRQKNLDLISGWRKDRKDPLMKRISSRLAGMVRRIFLDDGIHDSGCSLKVYKAECFEHVNLVGEIHRFIPALLKIKGFQVGEMIVNHRPRISGKTKYNWKRGIKGILDIIAVWFWKKYASRPLHLFGAFGLMLLAVSLIAGLAAVYYKIFQHWDLSNTVLTDLALFGFLTGMQFIVFGLLADILTKNYFASTNDEVYDIERTIER